MNSIYWLILSRKYFSKNNDNLVILAICSFYKNATNFDIGPSINLPILVYLVLDTGFSVHFFTFAFILPCLLMKHMKHILYLKDIWNIFKGIIVILNICRLNMVSFSLLFDHSVFMHSYLYNLGDQWPSDSQGLNTSKTLVFL